MNNELSVKSIVLILTVFGSLLAGFFWSNLRVQEFEGPSHMHVDPMGRLYIQVDNHLFQFEKDEQFIGDYDLASIGVESLVGDFAFFSNGDILLSRQPRELSFLKRLSIVKREDNNSDEYLPRTPSIGE